MTRILLAAMALLIAGTPGVAQGTAPTGAAAGTKTAAAPVLSDAQPASKLDKSAPALKGVGASSPEDAARKAAQDLAGRKSAATGAKVDAKPPAQAGQLTSTQPGMTAKPGASETPDSGTVGEFHPLPPDADSIAGERAGRAGSRRKSAASRMHGEVYGAGGGVGRNTGEAAGATSKSGKTSVYVQSEQTQGVANPPH